MFFSEEKNQKTFASLVLPNDTGNARIVAAGRRK
jgi:hypothetical protein